MQNKIRKSTKIIVDRDFFYSEFIDECYFKMESTPLTQAGFKHFHNEIIKYNWNEQSYRIRPEKFLCFRLQAGEKLEMGK